MASDNPASQLRWNNLRTGLLFVGGIVLIAVLALIIGRNSSTLTSKVKYKLFVSDIGGLEENNLVSVAGKKVGNVTLLTFKTRNDTIGVEIDMEVSDEFAYLITDSVVATIKGQGILGDKFVAITNTSPRGKKLAEGAYLPVVVEEGLDALTKQAGEVMTSLASITGKIDRGEGSAGKLLSSTELSDQLTRTASNLASFTDRLSRGNGLAAQLTGNSKLAGDATAMLANLNEVTLSLKQGKGSLGKLIVDEGFYNNLNSATRRADSLIARLDNPESSVGKLSRDPALYNNLNHSLISLDSLLLDFKKNPGRYVKVSVF